MAPRVILFDIDGTLVDCGGAGREAMEAAFVGTIGRSDVLSFGFGGMTDRSIARRGLEAAGRAATSAAIDTLLRAYLDHLAPALERSAGFRVLPGVHALLDALPETTDRAVGLGTGNLEPGATLKLVRGGLASRFSFGGFGSDAEDRAELLEAGARRGAERLGRARTDVEVIVVGDTPRDVDAGRAIGARVVAVATGRYDATALIEAGAHHTLRDLDGDAARALLR